MIQPLFKFVLIEPDEVKVEREETTSTGIVLSVKKEERPDLAVAKGLVVSVGSRVTDIQAGMRVLYNYFSGNSYKEFGADPTGKEDKEYHLVYEDDLIGREL